MTKLLSFVTIQIMMLREWRTTVSALLLVFVLLIPVTAMANGAVKHQDYGQEDSDLSSLYDSLNRSELKMVESLDHSLMVNYSFSFDEDQGERGVFVYSYDRDELNLCLEVGKNIGLLNATSLFEEHGGQFPSHEFVQDEYFPFYNTSEHLISFSEFHVGFIDSISEVVQDYNNVSYEDNGSDISLEALDSFHDASFELNSMEDSLNQMEQSVDEIDSQILDVIELNQKIDECLLLLESYKDILDQILNQIEEMPTSLTLYSPSVLHPGEVFEVEGLLIISGDYGVNSSIDIFVDGNNVITTETNSKGYYETSLMVPWNQSLGTMALKAEISEGDISSDVRTVTINKWDSELSVKLDSREYYEDNILLEGIFSTQAPIDLTEVNITGPEGGMIHPLSNGLFSLTYDAGNFALGLHSLNYTYIGNQTIKSSSADVSFEINVPTEIVIEEGPQKEYFDFDKEVAVRGKLLNASSYEVLPEAKVVLKIDGKNLTALETDSEGEFNYSTTVNELDLELGYHTVTLIFEGTTVYRDCAYSDIDFRVVEQELFGVASGDEIALLIVVLSSVALIGVLYRWRKGGKRAEVEGEEEEIPIISLVSEKLPEATSKEGIYRTYGELLRLMHSRGIVNITRGKTPRELAENIKESIGKGGKEEVDAITSIFEKAYFTQQPVTEGDIELFNNSVQKIEEVVS